MHFQLLLLALTFLFTPSLSSVEDILYIQRLTADFGIVLDSKNFKALATEFIPEATYDPGNGVVTGIPNIIKVLTPIVKDRVVQSAFTTQSITLVPTFDTQGGAFFATATTYATVSYIGQGALAGKVFVVYGSFRDSLKKTAEFDLYGGWKFSSRVFTVLVSTLQIRLLAHAHSLNGHQGTSGDRALRPNV